MGCQDIVKVARINSSGLFSLPSPVSKSKKDMRHLLSVSIKESREVTSRREALLHNITTLGQLYIGMDLAGVL
jgi:hypothetical protein